MIINFNITKNTTEEQMAFMVRDALIAFSDDIERTDGTTVRNYQLVHKTIGVNLIAQFLVNEAMNEAGRDVTRAKQLIEKVYLDRVREHLAETVELFFSQVVGGQAQMIEHEA